MKQSGTCKNNILLGANFSSHVKYLCEFICKEKHFCLSPNVMRNILLNLNNIFDIESKLQIVLTRERLNPEKPLLGSIIIRLLLKIVVFYGAVWELGPFSPNTPGPSSPRAAQERESFRGRGPWGGRQGSPRRRSHRECPESGHSYTPRPPGPAAGRGGAGRGAVRRGAARGARRAFPTPRRPRPLPRARRATTGSRRGRDPTRPAQSEARPHPMSLAVCQSDAERGGRAWAS